MFLYNIEIKICSILAKQKNLTVKKLYEKLHKDKIEQSLPNIYKIIKKLITEQIVIKKWKTLQLHSIYVNYIINLASILEQSYIEKDIIDIENLKSWQQKIFYGGNLHELDFIRANIIWQLVTKYPNTDVFYYNSHPYGTLAMPERDLVNLKELAKHTNKTYFLIGNDNFLDRYGASLLNLQGYEMKCIANTSFLDEWYCINIIWDYIVDCLFPNTIIEYFKIFFNTVDKPDDFNLDLFKNITKIKEKYSMKLTYSPEHAQKLRQQIKGYF